MSGSNTTSSGTPISALPLASSVAATDTMLGIVGGGTTTGGDARQVSVAVLGRAVSSAAGIPDAVSSATQAATQADAAAKKAYAAGGQAVQDQAGVAGGVAQLDKKAQLYLQGQSALAVMPATSATSGSAATPAMLTPLLPFHPDTGVGSDGETLGGMAKLVAGAVQEEAASQPNGFVALDANSIGQFTKAGFVIPMREGDTTSPLQVGYYANYRELTYRVTTPGGNILAFENLASNGYAAITFRGPDNYGNPTAAFGTTSFEHGAIGYGPGLNWGQSRGYTFWEISSFDGNSDPKLRSVPGIIQETGAHFSSYQEAQAVINYNTNTLTTVDGSLWPEDINGQVIVCQTTPDAMDRNATIVSGAGTDTIIVSQQIYTDSRDKMVGDLFRFGPTIYSQTDHTVSQSCGNWDYYTFDSAYDGSIKKLPFFSIDRVAGRIGINRPDPKTSFHMVGQALFSTTTKFDAYSLRFNAAQAVNVVPGGTATGNDGATGQNSLFYWYGIGKNALVCNWTAANQIQFVDVNYNSATLTVYMDGSQRVKVEKLFGLPSLTKAEILVLSGEDGDCVMCSDLGVPVVYSTANAGWFPMTVGAKISA